MTSTYLDYRVYTQDLAKTLKRTAAQTQIAREAEYYRANIGKVKSVEEFLKDDRLYNYAMQAHGLTDMIKSKAFMKKVLQSDLDDPKSFARSLVDTRYQVFARAFNFDEKGKVETSIVEFQTQAQEDETAGFYSEARIKRGETAAAEIKNYQDRVGVFTSVDGFLRDERMVTMALTAYGIDPKFASMTTLKSVLTSDLSDPDSVANKLAATGTAGQAYLDLAKAFGFSTDGSVPDGASMQTEAQMNELIYRYYEKTGNASSPSAAAFKSELFGNAVATATSVDDLLNDSRVFEYVVTAFGLDPTLESKDKIRQVLTSDLSDPDSFANQQTDTRYKTMAAAFNFDTDGSIKGTDGAQTVAQLESTIDLYFEHYDDKAVNSEALDTAYFRNRLASIQTVDQLISDTRLYTYLLASYGLDASVESKATMKRVLTSDVSDPKSFANTARDTRYRELAAAVNFGADGKITTARMAQVNAEELETVRLYSSRIPSDATELVKTRAKAESTYYHEAISKVENVEQFLADKRLVTYVLKAYGLDGATVPNSELRKVLLSDPQDPASYANKLGDTRYRDLAAAYNFGDDGKISRVPLAQAQTQSNALETADLYLYQQMEVEAGNQNEGVRLALYFRRKAANINTSYDILADKALLEVARTALGLPATMSQMDIDVQAKVLDKRLEFADFKDATKLDQFIARFAGLYDQANNSDLSASPASIILGSSSSSGGGGTFTPVEFSQSLLASFQGLRIGR